MPSVDVRKMMEPSGRDAFSQWTRLRAPQRTASNEDLSSRFERHIARLPASRLDDAIAAATETVAVGLAADRVRLHLRDPDQATCFSETQSWSRPGSGPEPPGPAIDLTGLDELVADLEAGRTAFIDTPDGLTQEVLRSGASVWLVPIPAPDRMAGFFLIEGLDAGSHWMPEQREGPARVAAILSQFFERHRLHVELEESRRLLNRNERLEVVGQVASSVAHDFNNVLTAILGYSDLLEMELPEGAVGHGELAEIRAAASRAGALVEQILSFAKGSSRDTSLGACACEVSEQAHALRGMLERIVGAKIDLRCRFMADRLQVELDPARLESILLNLVANARDAIAEADDPRGHVVIETRTVVIDHEGIECRGGREGRDLETALQPGRYQRLSVRDDGVGMGEETRERLFEPFYTTKGKERGTGLGLANVSEQMKQMGGAIAVESAPSEGADFHLYFPIQEPGPPR